MAKRKWSPAAVTWWANYPGSIDVTAVMLAFEAGEKAGRESVEAELRRLRERIAKMAEREERYRQDATQRLDDLDAASYDRSARVLRSLLVAEKEG